jgi:hypothetical protein
MQYSRRGTYLKRHDFLCTRVDVDPLGSGMIRAYRLNGLLVPALDRYFNPSDSVIAALPIIVLHSDG